MVWPCSPLSHLLPSCSHPPTFQPPRSAFRSSVCPGLSGLKTFVHGVLSAWIAFSSYLKASISSFRSQLKCHHGETSPWLLYLQRFFFVILSLSTLCAFCITFRLSLSVYLLLVCLLHRVNIYVPREQGLISAFLTTHYIHGAWKLNTYLLGEMN